MVASKMQKLVAAAPLTQEEADACELVLRSLNLEPSLFTAISELLEFRDQAELETSFGESTVMSPGADVGKLIGFVTLPADFADEDATATITCSSGVSDTVAIN